MQHLAHITEFPFEIHILILQSYEFDSQVSLLFPKVNHKHWHSTKFLFLNEF